jgi:GNAT superfamily N-acetyltransferase
LIDYRVIESMLPEQFIGVLQRSSLAERRPVDQPDCIEGMLRHADLLVTAWQGEQLVGIARSVTDFNYCCYLSDLAVDQKFHRMGIGRELIRKTRQQLGPECMLILLAAPAAEDYYPHIGFTRHESAWVLSPDDPLN